MRNKFEACYLGPDYAITLVPSVIIPSGDLPPKRRLYAMRGDCVHAAVYDLTEDRWCGLWQCPTGTNIRALIEAGTVRIASVPPAQWESNAPVPHVPRRCQCGGVPNECPCDN